MEEYIDFVHAVVQSGSNPKSTGTIREDQFFPSMADIPVGEVRKRANLVMRLMGRMVEVFDPSSIDFWHSLTISG